MKVIVLLSVLLAVLAIFLPAVYASGAPLVSDCPDSVEPEPEPDPDSDAPSPYYSAASIDDSMTITLLNGDTVAETSMSDYLFGAVAAEMPASFSSEALKAQSVALRTYVLYKMKSPTDAHPDADICTDSTCCAAWCDSDYLRDKWGEDYATYSDKISSAVSATDGEYLSYDGEPILAVFHPSSAGKTEAASAVWSSDLPYLVSVDSPETSADVPNYVSSVTVTTQEFKDTILAAHPDAVFPDDTTQWLSDIEYTDSDRIHTLRIGGTTVTGSELRSMFSLRSTAISFDISESAITMTSTGYGHGVGMSQYGANVLAESGSTFDEILALYYPGTVLSVLEL